MRLMDGWILWRVVLNEEIVRVGNASKFNFDLILCLQ